MYYENIMLCLLKWAYLYLISKKKKELVLSPLIQMILSLPDFYFLNVTVAKVLKNQDIKGVPPICKIFYKLVIISIIYPKSSTLCKS